jgi:hypothetical protein
MDGRTIPVNIGVDSKHVSLLLPAGDQLTTAWLVVVMNQDNEG